MKISSGNEEKMKAYFDQTIFENQWILFKWKTLSFHLIKNGILLHSSSLDGTTKRIGESKTYNQKILPLIDSIELMMKGEGEELVKAHELFLFLHQTIMIKWQYDYPLKQEDDEIRYRLLYQVTETFHMSMDVQAILHEIIRVISQLYPEYVCRLMLIENNEDEHLPIIPLDLSMEETPIMAAQAFISGDIQVTKDDKQSLLYAPLNGHQGIYGVLEMKANSVKEFTPQDVQFIQLLASTAGSALENAKLYQQSQRLIADLKLINQTSHELNSSLKLKEIISYMKGQIIDSFHADEVGFVHFRPTFSILPGSTSFFLTPLCDHFVKHITALLMSGKESLFSGDILNNWLYPSIPYRSLMAVPMNHNKQVIGMIIALNKETNAFTYDAFKLLQSVVFHSTIALVNAMLREELEHMVNTDHLTKLYNRTYLDKRIEKTIIQSAEGIFALIDIDNFKSINDTFGHQVGDQILIQVANVLTKNLRNRDVAARWGGEELAIYLPDVSKKVGGQIANRIVHKVKKETEPTVTVSCGIAYWSKASGKWPISLESLVQRADKALYAAKNSGKNKVVIDS